MSRLAELMEQLTEGQKSVLRSVEQTTDGRVLVPSLLGNINHSVGWPKGMTSYYSAYYSRLTPLGLEIFEALRTADAEPGGEVQQARAAMLAGARIWWARNMSSDCVNVAIKGNGRVDVYWADADESGCYTLPIDFLAALNATQPTSNETGYSVKAGGEVSTSVESAQPTDAEVQIVKRECSNPHCSCHERLAPAAVRREALEDMERRVRGYIWIDEEYYDGPDEWLPKLFEIVRQHKDGGHAER